MLKDKYNRAIDYLRVSVTDRCNLRCRYCMPQTGVTLKPREELLSLEELAELVSLGVDLGVRKVRFTGGEPLVRKNLASLVERVASMPGVEDVAITTNGILLAPLVAELKQAGLNRVNISLDTLDAERFRWLTRGGDITGVFQGMVAALEAGLNPVKLNTVIMPGVNRDEAIAFANLTLRYPVHVRFIELMPVGSAEEYQALPVDEVRDFLESNFKLRPATDLAGAGPAEYFHIPGGLGTLGFIGAISHRFCERCNRVRLTADGRLRPCLHGNREVDLAGPLRSGVGRENMLELFRQGVALKPKEHTMEADGWGNQPRSMSQIGG